jgi:phosphoesterase RecJ-like protein
MTPASPIDWAAFRALIQQHDRFLLTSHIRPDCDALGSELGMAGVLEAMGKSVRVVNGQTTPPNLAFIDPAGKLETIDEDVTADELADRQVMIVLDTSAWAQLGPMGDVLRGAGPDVKKAVLDHHVGEDDLSAMLFKNTSAEATGRLVFEAAQHLGVPVTPEIATPLFAALATDTGWFRFPSAGPVAYRAAADMIAAGAYPPEIYAALYERDTAGRVRLRGVILSRVETLLDGALVHTHVLKEDFGATGSLPSDTEDVINLTLAIEGTRAAVILIEQPGGGFKISFRSRCQMDCSQVARSFGGGGHKAAAGAFVEGTLDEVRPRVLQAVMDAMSQ